MVKSFPTISSTESMSKKPANVILYISFFLSGAAGLIYEVLWVKYLVLIFGNTAYAHSLVLGTFMGGLALGSFFGGKLADRIKNKLSLYLWLQIGIALYCLFTPFFFAISKQIYISAAEQFLLNVSSVIILKFFIGAVIILPPTILMGATMPVLSKCMIRSISARGKTVARLYYMNNFGAVIGIFTVGFYLIYQWGLNFSVVIAAFINILAGAAVLAVKVFYPAYAFSISEGNQRIKEEGEPDFVRETAFSSRVIMISLLGIFISGFAAMLYEMVWIRLLSLILGSSTYSFSLMLAAFISGITIGAFIISRCMPKGARVLLWFGGCELCIGLLLIGILPFYEKLPLLFAWFSRIFSRGPETFMFYSGIKFFLALLVMLPSTICLGMILPLVSKIVSYKRESLGRKIGSVFAWNTLGNILGVLTTGLILIPFLGLKLTLELGIIISLSVGVVILFIDKTFLLRRKLTIVVILFLIFTGYKIFIPEWNKRYFHAQFFRPGYSLIKIDQLAERIRKKKKELYYRDGLNATVAVLGDKEHLALFVNGKADASANIEGEGDIKAQTLCAHLPLLLKSDIENVLVVGLGSGITCGSALLHPVKRLDLIEISSSVVEASKYFSDYNYDPFSDKRFHLHVEDAKTFLQRTKRKYDLIISEPSNPWMSGVGALFTEEYFADCYSHLEAQGIMLQWVQAYEMDDKTYETILRTFISVFPYVTIWNLGQGDTLLLGSKDKIAVDFARIRKRIAEEGVKKDLSRIGVHDLFTLFSFQLASNKYIRESIDIEGMKNNDYFPVLEYRAPIALYTGASVNDFLVDLDERNILPAKSNLIIKDYLAHCKIDRRNFKNLYDYLNKSRRHSSNLYQALIKKWHKDYPHDKEAAAAYAESYIGCLDSAICEFEELIAGGSQHEYLSRYADFQFKRYKTIKSFLLPGIFSDIVDELTMCANESDGSKIKFYYLLGSVSLGNREYEKAVKYYSRIEAEIDSGESIEAREFNSVGLFVQMTVAYFRLGDEDKALEYAAKALKIDKKNVFARAFIEQIKGR